MHEHMRRGVGDLRAPVDADRKSRARSLSARGERSSNVKLVFILAVAEDNED